MELEVTIERLGAQGDGIAEGPNGPLYVPFALPGERVRIETQPGEANAVLRAVLIPSTARTPHVCGHFGACGGCVLQHMEEGAYLAWKREQVIAALHARGIDAPVELVTPVPVASRRRASFVLARPEEGVVLGYRRRASHEIIPIEACPVLAPSLGGSLSGLRQALTPLLQGRNEARVLVTAADNGLDIAVEGVPEPADPRLRARIAAEAAAIDIARLSVAGETIYLARNPAVTLGQVTVPLPGNAFLQASREAEAALIAHVKEGVGKAKHIADLFAGLGTFTFALAERAKVDAFEEDQEAVAALGEGVKRATGLKPIKALPRDLFRNPLTAPELRAYDAVVFDPPRAGAKAQSEALAKSKIARIVAVSCNPATLARDLRTLIDGGYRLTRVMPVDQFVFSPHIEVVAHLTR